MTTWMSGPCQGDREGQREASCFLPPPFPQAHCAAFVPRLRLASPFPSCSVCFRLPLITAMPLPHTSQRIEMSAQDMGPIYVNPACPCVALVSLQPGPARAPLSQGLVLSPTSRAQSGFSHLQVFCRSQPEVPLPTGAGVRPAPSVGGTWSPLSPSLSSLDLLSVP